MYVFKREGIHAGRKQHILGFDKKFIREFIWFIRPKIILLKELTSFMRPETCLFIAGMAVSGFLLFNILDTRLIFLFLTAFFTTAATYSYNYLTDKEEDLVNNKKLNVFVVNGKGTFAVVGFIFLSFIFASFLSKLAFILYILWITSGFFYSRCGVKKIFLVKNIYTGLAMSLSFLIGSVADGQLIVGVTYYILLVALSGFSINVLGDLRGYEGDKSEGVATIPVLFGCGVAKKVLYLSFSILLLSIVGLHYREFYPLIPPLLLATLFLTKNNLKKTRYSVLSSHMLTATVLFITSFSNS